MALAFPSSPTTGQIHTTAGRSWRWTGSRWARHDLAGAVVSATAPVNPVPGMRWIHEDQGRAYEYLDSTWVELGGGGGGGTSGPVSYNDLTDLPTLGTAAATASSDYATAAQGAKADSALQASSLTPYRTSAAQDLIDAGKAASSHTHDDRYYTETEVDTFLAGKQAAGSYATAAQGAKADSSLQPGAAISEISGLQTALDGKQAAGSYATLVGGLVPASQLPSYVDDVIETANFAALPNPGETGKIYVADGKIYRWSGSAMVEISPSPGSTDAVTEGTNNLYFTAARAVSALASTLSSYATQAWVAAQNYATTSALNSAISALVTGVSSVAGKTGAVTLAKGDVGLGNVDNTSDAAKPISTATQTALDGKASTSHSHPLSQLTQSSATNGQVATWNGTAWVPQAPTLPSTVSAITITGEAGFGVPVETKASPTISSNSLSLNLSIATFFVVNLNSAITSLTFSNTPTSPKVYSFTLQFIADGTARSVTWPASVKWAGGTIPTLTSASGKIDILSFLTHDGGTTWLGFVSGQNF